MPEPNGKPKPKPLPKPRVDADGFPIVEPIKRGDDERVDAPPMRRQGKPETVTPDAVLPDRRISRFVNVTITLPIDTTARDTPPRLSP